MITEHVSNLLEGFQGLDGFQQISRRSNRNPRYLRRFNECARIWDACKAGELDPFFLRQAFNPTSPVAWEHLTKIAPAIFNEAMNSGDFTALTADVLDRLLYANYNETPMHWTSIAKKAILRDFRQVKRFVVNGAEGEYELVQENAPPAQRAIVQPAPYTYEPEVYAGAATISWRAVINDDIGIFTDLPARLARGGRRTIEKFVTRKYVDASGPHASLYTVGNGNIVTSNPVLSVPALGTALKVMYKQVDYDGEPIEIEGLSLVVGPALYNTAMNIMNSVTIDMTEGGGTSGQRIRVNNWIISGMKVVKNPQIPLIASSANGDTSWFLFADPNVGRPAIEVGFLSGFDTPQLFMKAGNTMRIGGGVDPTLGDFSTMLTELKAISVHGGTIVDPKMTVASNGSGS